MSERDRIIFSFKMVSKTFWKLDLISFYRYCKEEFKVEFDLLFLLEPSLF